MLLLSVLILAVIAAMLSTACAQNESVTATFTNTERFWFDVDGDQIDAYGNKINCACLDLPHIRFTPLLKLLAPDSQIYRF